MHGQTNLTDDHTTKWSLTMLVEELTLGISINSNIAVESNDLATKKGISLFHGKSSTVDDRILNDFLKRSVAPQTGSEVSVVNLVPVIHPNCFTLFGLARGSREWKSRQEADICLAQ